MPRFIYRQKDPELIAGGQDRSTPIGKMIDSYLKGQLEIDDHAVHLLFSANRWEAAAQMRADIASGTTLVVDRYSYSGAVYSSAKPDADIDLKWAWQPEVGLPEPDLWLFLDIDPGVAEQRGGFGSERYEKTEMQKIVRESFRALLNSRLGDRGRVVYAGLSLELVAQEVIRQVEPLFDASSGVLQQPLGMMPNYTVFPGSPPTVRSHR